MPDWIFQAMGYIGGLAVLYAGIRADLARLHEKAENAARDAERANGRIDHFFDHQGRQHEKT